ncbi:MAG: isoprenylcysteine carboxylmethyltransferase family protein [Gammaproteobacteria bacterium]|nr:isoprenylcysteine carboxylmethyltransferase family protein [Gammaproteobacteria bacterium]MDP2141772.1 isoprenylcysteine carboxylmethyltransferase family protein [Gammaproteobacteria bacterium]MDP2347994.1 isoprenylcysteine carboxylmethyltransferase family protein [Gammaproteobacteria bacterium]
MTSLENRIPPPLVAALLALCMWLLAGSDPALSSNAIILATAVASVVLVGISFCVSGVISFRRASTTVNPLQPQKASALVTSGVYRISRNPMYVGFTFLLLGWALALGEPLAFIGVPVFVLFITRFQILPEERALTALFGAEFERYCTTVRRWL